MGSTTPTHQLLGNATSKLPQKHAEPTSADLKGSSFGLKTLCWNAMGLTTVKEVLEELLRWQDPDIIIMTETKLIEKTQRKYWLNNILKTHWLRFSSCPHSSLSQGEREGSGGIALAVRKSLVPAGCCTRIPVREDHRSRLLQLVLQYPKVHLSCCKLCTCPHCLFNNRHSPTGSSNAY